MGGLYNKGAQLAASQQLIMPPRLVEELKECFENMPPRQWKVIEKAIAACMGDGDVKKGRIKMAEEFKEIDQEPLAAASIGQVHTATLASGERVVIKILYPEIRRNMVADLKTMKSSIQLIVAFLGLQDMKKMIDVFYAEIASNFPRELDFQIERAHSEFARHLLQHHSPNIVVPHMYADLSGTQMLTQEMVDGDTLNKIGRDQDPKRLEDGRKVLNQVIDAFGRMIFKDGFFHADPHPGNIMVLRDGRPAVIDWGQCVKLTIPQRRRLCQMVMILRTRCAELVISGLNNAGFSFPAQKPEITAAIIFFFFDSAVESPFTADIEEFGATIRSAPSSLPLPTDMPREVIFFARVMQCLRRDCEVLGVDISAIDRWALVAREGLHDIVYNRVPRNLSIENKDQEEDEDDSSAWSPSRLLLTMNPGHFDFVQMQVKWAQAHPHVGDAGLVLAERVITAHPWILDYLDAGAKNARVKSLASDLLMFCCSNPRLVLLFLVGWTFLFLVGCLESLYATSCIIWGFLM